MARTQLADFIQRERDLIRAANLGRAGDMPNRWLGLALSGGGIRSASFALGILQALHNWHLFRRIDYLSTVSGGGYIGTSLTYFLKAKEMGRDGLFPFGRRRQAGARSVQVDPPEEKAPLLRRLWTTIKSGRMGAAPSKSARSAAPRRLPDPTAIVSYIRLHAHYLTPSPDLSWPAFIGSAIRAAFTALAIYFPLLLAVMTFVAWSEFILGQSETVLGYVEKLSCWGQLLLVSEQGGSVCRAAQTEVDRVVFLNWPVLALLLVTAISILVAFAYVIKTDSATRDPARRANVYPGVTLDNTRLNGRLLILFVVFALLSALPWLVHFFNLGLRAMLTASASTLIGYLGTLWDYRSRLKGSTGKGSIFSSARPIVFAALTAYGLLVFALAAAEKIVAWNGAYTGWAVGPCAIAAMLLFSLVLNAFSNLNLISQHRLYRDRLMEAFCPSDSALAKMKWRPSLFADLLQVKDCAPGIWGSPDALPGPYHIINTALVAPGSKTTLYRSRGGDNFVLSPVASGSDATGWVETAAFMNGYMTLPTAMAISGAALNAHSGAGEQAPTRNAMLGFLLTLFGAQLGYWAPHPMADPTRQTRQPKFLRPGLYGLTGWRLDADLKRGFVQLADGGHFENLALYELIRRRTDLVICSDAGQDKDYVFEDLGIAVERVRVDFGAIIDFCKPEYALQHMLPESAPDGNWTKRYGLAKRGFAISTIRYPEAEDPITKAVLPAKVGYLLFFKSTLVDGLPLDLYAYKKLNTDFPDQTTVDQDFDEYQFEAYRELGYQLATQCFVELFGSSGDVDVTMRLLWERLQAACGTAGP